MCYVVQNSENVVTVKIAQRRRQRKTTGTSLKRGPGIGGLFPAFRKKYLLFPAFHGFFPDFPVSATFHCLFGFFRLSAAFKWTFPVSANFKLCFPVSTIFSNFSRFPWLKMAFSGFRHKYFFRFSAELFWFLRFSVTFLRPFRLSAKSIPAQTEVECTCSVAAVYTQCMTAHTLQRLCSVHCNYTA